KELLNKNYDAAHQHLVALIENWRLDAKPYQNAVQWLFQTSLHKDSHGEIVKYFEIIKEKYPSIELSFEDILKVALSYRELSEYERSYLVYRSTVEASFQRESQVAGFLNGRGEFIRSVAAMERLLRDYPAESYVATATYALAQEVYRRAPTAHEDSKLKARGLTRSHLINASIEMLDHFVSNWPNDPADDQASFALATALIDLDQYEAAIERCEAFAQRYPDSRLLDSFWYMIGYSHFELEHHQQALEMCEQVAQATFPVPETGGKRAADNKWEAIYIMGQVYHSLGRAADAIMQYAKVKQRFADAAEAIDFFSRKEIRLDEVTTIKPDAPKKLQLRFRNLPEVAIKVYRIDLMKFGLMQRNLDRITAINLAGIKPYHEQTVALGDGKDYRDRYQDLELPLREEGAYLVVCRGENLYASGLVLVSPLTLHVAEDVTSGRVRVSVKNAAKDQFVDDVHVKVIGSANDQFQSGSTDLRGLFVADDIKGTSTVIAQVDMNQYAFFRGELPLQGVLPQLDPQSEVPNQQVESEPSAPAKAGKALLRGNIFDLNGGFQMQQKGNFENLLNNEREGIAPQEAY
ncbi:MAG: tetratricopeptide repeat protein, partial [Pirellulales bacterium]|nr:tetratricopeptide repeat protein [Pirellulales bacterium]